MNETTKDPVINTDINCTRVCIETRPMAEALLLMERAAVVHGGGILSVERAVVVVDVEGNAERVPSHLLFTPELTEIRLS